MATQVMLDLETLGTTPGSVILSIGAVKFNDGGILSEFYIRINPGSCQQMGLTIDAETVLWWMQQSEEARSEFTKETRSLPAALSSFSIWLEDPENKLWGNGPTLDQALLSAAYRVCSLPLPWDFRNERCYRTARDHFPEQEFTRQGTHHNALDDARDQALHLIKISSNPTN